MGGRNKVEDGSEKELQINRWNEAEYLIKQSKVRGSDCGGVDEWTDGRLQTDKGEDKKVGTIQAAE